MDEIKGSMTSGKENGDVHLSRPQTRSVVVIVESCPECDATVPFTASPKLGQRVTCSNCRAELAVIGLAPLELDWAFLEPFENPTKAKGRDQITKLDQ